MAEIKGFGRLGSEPELKMVGENKDKPVTEFRLFLSSLKKRNNETTDQGGWFSVSVWGKFAEASAKLLKTGDPVYLEGTVRTDHWENKDGEEQTSMSIDARHIFPHLPAIISLDFKPRKADNNASDNGADGGHDAIPEEALAESST